MRGTSGRHLVVLCFSICCAGASAQTKPTDIAAVPGFEATKSLPTSSVDLASRVNSGQLADMLGDDMPLARGASVLMRLAPEPARSMRGAASIKVYRRAAPAVVLVVSDSGIGSGSLLNAHGDVLTNWHVVQGYRNVGVVFKPAQEGRRLTKTDLRRASVVRVDEVSDLALLRVEAVPEGVAPIELGTMADAVVGADVHAIGHPTGEAWTYTMGVISQIRRDYKWTTESNKAHKADVIQTQTPISQGNSGGPLLDADGRLIGVNSFKSQGEALNFAVAVDDVRQFLSAKVGRVAATAPARNEASSAGASCEPKRLYAGVDSKKQYERVGIDVDCDGRVDVEFRSPLDTREPLYAVADKNGDGKPDIVYFSDDRGPNWVLSYYDTNFDGNWDLVGHHRRGDTKPQRFEPYAQYVARR